MTRTARCPIPRTCAGRNAASRPAQAPLHLQKQEDNRRGFRDHGGPCRAANAPDRNQDDVQRDIGREPDRRGRKEASIQIDGDGGGMNPNAGRT